MKAVHGPPGATERGLNFELLFLHSYCQTVRSNMDCLIDLVQSVISNVYSGEEYYYWYVQIN